MPLEDSLCPNKNVCGSCGWSDLPYPDQLTKKLNGINEAAVAAKLDVVCPSIIPSPVTSHYRNRMDFIVDYKGNFGLREKGKWWKVIDNHTCFLPDQKIIDLFNKLYPWVKEFPFGYYDRKANTGYLRYIVIRTSTLGESMVIILTTTPETPELANKIKDYISHLEINTSSLIWSTTSATSDISLGEKYETVRGNDYIKETINGFTYAIRPDSFFQTNPFGAGVLQNKVISLVTQENLESSAVVLDLYCGSGFFTLPLSRNFKNVIGVESVESAINDANQNAHLNNLETKFICSPTEKVDISLYKPNFVIVDPPRAGLHPKVIKDLLAAKPDSLLYVSCKYQRFFEEFKEFVDTYRVKECVAIDMFPHTPHVELVTLLKRI